MLSTVALGGSRMAAKIAWATLSGDIILRRGAWGQRVFQISVSVAPVCPPMTRIPRGRSSSRKVLVKPSAPCFEAFVGGGTGKDPGGGDGEIIHNRSTGSHHAERSLRDQECAVEIGCEHVFPYGKRKLLDRQGFVARCRRC